MFDIISLVEKLNNAYNNSTQPNNRFAKAIKSIKWDNVFEADGETYYCKGDNFTLTVENIDPFKQMWKPSIMFDCTCLELGF